MTNIDNAFGLDDFEVDEAPSGFNAEPSSIRGTVRIGKTVYAVDLEWSTPNEPSKADAEARAHALGQSDKANFYCVFNGMKTQYAVGYASMGHKTNQPVLAAHICQAKGTDFVAAFEVDGGFYLLGVSQGNILSDAERFYADEESAIRAMEQLLAQQSFDDIIAPASFGLRGSKEAPITTLLSGRPPVRLKDVSRASFLMKIGLVVAFAGIVLFGGRYYLDYQEQARIAEQLRQLSEQAQSSVGLKQKQEVKIPDMPWVGKPLAVKALDMCGKEIRKFPLGIPGWAITNVECRPSGNGVGVTGYLNRKNPVERGGVPMTFAIQAIQDSGLPGVWSSREPGSGQSLGWTWTVQGLPLTPVDIKTETIPSLSKNIVQLFESRWTSVQISPADANEYWDGITIEFKTETDPMSFADIIAAVPGLVLESVDYRIDTGTYTIKGKAYEQKPLPVQKPAS